MNTIDQKALNQLFIEARTFSQFIDQPITDAEIHAIYDLTKWAPTSMNCQPARFIFIRSKVAREKLKDALAPSNVDKTMNAPLTVIVAYDSQFQHHLPTQFPAYDAKPMFDSNPDLTQETAFRNGTLSAAYFIVAARALGFDCGPMSGFNSASVDAEFFAGTHYKSNLIINIGHGNKSTLYPRGPRLAFNEVAKIV